MPINGNLQNALSSLTSAQISAIDQILNSNSSLLNQLNYAADQGYLTSIQVQSLTGENGEYNGTTINLPASDFENTANLAFLLGHEAWHAYNDAPDLEEQNDFYSNLNQITTDGGSNLDYTWAYQNYLQFELTQESYANINGWNAYVQFEQQQAVAQGWDQATYNEHLSKDSPYSQYFISYDESTGTITPAGNIALNDDYTVDLSDENITAEASLFSDSSGELGPYTNESYGESFGSRQLAQMAYYANQDGLNSFGFNFSSPGNPAVNFDPFASAEGFGQFAQQVGLPNGYQFSVTDYSTGTVYYYTVSDSGAVTTVSVGAPDGPSYTYVGEGDSGGESTYQPVSANGEVSVAAGWGAKLQPGSYPSDVFLQNGASADNLSGQAVEFWAQPYSGNASSEPLGANDTSSATVSGADPQVSAGVSAEGDAQLLLSGSDGSNVILGPDSSLVVYSSDDTVQMGLGSDVETAGGDVQSVGLNFGTDPSSLADTVFVDGGDAISASSSPGLGTVTIDASNSLIVTTNPAETSVVGANNDVMNIGPLVDADMAGYNQQLNLPPPDPSLDQFNNYMNQASQDFANGNIDQALYDLSQADAAYQGALNNDLQNADGTTSSTSNTADQGLVNDLGQGGQAYQQFLQSLISDSGDAAGALDLADYLQSFLDPNFGPGGTFDPAVLFDSNGVLAGFTSLDTLLADDPDPTPKDMSDAVNPFMNALSDPLVIDTTGAGLNLTPLTSNSPEFSFIGGAQTRPTGWVGGGTGFLALMPSDGVITAADLFGPGAANGFAALAALAPAGSTVINASDPGWANLVVWEDPNPASGQGETYTMAQLGIVSISLVTTPINEVINGNSVMETALATLSDGQTLEVGDVQFATSLNLTPDYGIGDFTSAAAALPAIDGYGNIQDLRTTMSQNSELLSSVQNLLAISPTDGQAFDGALQQVLYSWTGVGSIDPTTNGAYFDAQKLGVLEGFLGIPFAAWGVFSSPVFSDQTTALSASYASLFDGIEARFLVQDSNSPLSSAFEYDPVTDYIYADSNLINSIELLASQAPSDPSATVTYWTQALDVISDVAANTGASSSSAATSSLLQSDLPTEFAPNVLVAAATGVLTTIDVEPSSEAVFGSGVIYGAPGADLFNFLAPNMTVDAQGGGDDFLISSGSGNETINENDPAGTAQDTLSFGPGITASDLTVSFDSSGDVIVAYDTQGDQVALTGMEANSSSGVGEVLFADGTSLTGAQLMALATTGSATHTQLYGGPGGDVFNANGYATYEQGNGGADTFLYDAGWDALEINENRNFWGSPSIATLQFGPEITEADLTVRFDSAGDVVITDGTPGDQVKLDGMYSSSSFGVSEIEFNDGTTLSYQQIINLGLVGAPDNTMLYGTGGADTFDSEGYARFEQGNGGADTFLYDAGWGALEINENGYWGGPSSGVLQFGPGITAADLTITSNSAGDIIITDGTPGDQITLDGMASNNDQGAAFLDFADGTTLSWQQVVGGLLTGSPTNTQLNGPSSPSVFDSEGYATYERGNSTADTFLYDAGWGDLVISENGAWGGPSSGVLQFGAGISESDLTITSDSSGDVVITNGTAGDKITIGGMASTNDDGVGEITFADGSSLSWQQIIDDYILTGSPTNTQLNGPSNPSVFNANGYATYERGNTTSDTFLYDAGWGALEISENGSWGGPSAGVLDFGPGITAAALTITSNASGNVVITDGTAGDQITLDGMGSSNVGGVAEITFADGASLDYQQVINLALTGAPTKTQLYGSNGADTFTSDGYATYEQGNGAADTFLYDAGWGTLEINESNSGDAVLQLGTGIIAADLSATATASGNLIVTDGTTGDQITLDGMMNNQGDGVATVDFADGSSITGQQLINLALIGSPTNTQLYGSVGADTFNSNGYATYEQGNGGADTFLYDAGWGQLEINESNSGNAVLQFGPGISEADFSVSATTSGNLVVTDGTTGDQITLDGMMNAQSNGVAAVDFADGSSITGQQLINLALIGSPTNTQLYGSFGADTFASNGYARYEQGNGGADTFLYDAGWGALEIYESNGGWGVPTGGVLQFGPGITEADVSFSTTADSSIIITDGTPGDQITVDLMVEDDQAGLAEITFADGSSLNWQQIIDLALTGSPTNTRLYGTSGSDLFDSNGYATYEQGNNGADTFLYDAGWGALEINENAGGWGAPATGDLQFGPAINLADLNFSTDSNGDVIITDGTAGDQITIDGMAGNTTMGMASVTFMDGTSLNYQQVVALATTGSLNNTTVDSGQTMALPAAWTVSDITVQAGGALVGAGTLEGASTVAGLVSGAAIGIGSASSGGPVSGWVEITSGGLAQGVIVQNGALQIDLGGVASGTLLSGSGALAIVNGNSFATTVNAGAVEEIGSGGLASGELVEGGGSIIVSSGATASGVTVGSAGEAEVSGSASGTIIQFGGESLVSSGGIETGAIVESGGTESVLAGGASLSVTVAGGGTLAVSGGVASGAIIQSGGIDFVTSGGVDSGAVISGGATQDVVLGGTAVSATVQSGGFEELWLGGTASAVSVLSHGALELAGKTLSSGTTAAITETSATVLSGVTVSSGGSLDYDNATVLSGATLTVLSGAAAFATTISSGGRETMSSGGLASGDIVSSGGSVSVFSGGVDVGATVIGGGLIRNSGGALSGAHVLGSIVAYSGGVIVSATISSGGTVGAVNSIESGTIVLGGGVQNVSSGSFAYGATLSSGGNQYDAAGGMASGTIVMSGATDNVVAGTAVGTVLSGGRQYIAAIGTASGTIVSSGGQMSALGSASSAIVLNGGFEAVYSGGVVRATTVSSGGILYVSSGGVESGATILGGGSGYVRVGAVASGDVISSGGVETVSSGGRVSATSVMSGGVLYISSGGTDAGATIVGGGSEMVKTGAIASGDIISSGGAETVSSGGTISGATVMSGAQLTVSSGAVLGQSLVLSGGTATILGVVSSGITVTIAGSGDLVLDDAQAFSGLISGLSTTAQKIDLGGFAYSSTGETVSWTEAGSGLSGTLTVSGGGKSASLSLIGSYVTSNFQLSSDGAGGTIIVDPPLTEFSQLMAGETLSGDDLLGADDNIAIYRPPGFLAQAMAAFGGDSGPAGWFTQSAVTSESEELFAAARNFRMPAQVTSAR
jgi:autotransporter passenger strand-loop-strand repeat protein